ncbi:hypothetical protein GCM10026982_17850 [Nocardiopsis aegyptia]
MNRYERRCLAVLHSARQEDGGDVLNHMLLTGLAHEMRVTLLTVGAFGDFGQVDVVTLPRSGGPVGATQARIALREAISHAGPAGIGLPSDPRHFEVVLGSGWISGEAANLVRRAYYPSAITVNGLHIDPVGVGRAQGDAVSGRVMARTHREVFKASDMVFAPGPKAARDARWLLGEEHPLSRTLVHELIPGVTPATPASKRRGDSFEILMLGRVEDRNKGALDVARAVGDLLRWSDQRVRLTLRGVPPAQVPSFQAFMEGVVGEAGAARVLPFTTQRARIGADIDAADALITASETGAYGLVAGECAARGKPFLVARGNGNGFVELLTCRREMTAGSAFVVEDSGTVSSYGRIMGPARPYAGPRHRVLAHAIARLVDDYDRMAGHARNLRSALAAYTPANMAQAFAEAVQRAVVGDRRRPDRRPAADSSARRASLRSACRGEKPCPQHDCRSSQVRGTAWSSRGPSTCPPWSWRPPRRASASRCSGPRPSGRRHGHLSARRPEALCRP